LLYIENKSQEGKDKGLISGIRNLKELRDFIIRHFRVKILDSGNIYVPKLYIWS
jgi:hypothetical protein